MLKPAIAPTVLTTVAAQELWRIFRNAADGPNLSL
jgi:hypothetical protein